MRGYVLSNIDPIFCPTSIYLASPVCNSDPLCFILKMVKVILEVYRCPYVLSLEWELI